MQYKQLHIAGLLSQCVRSEILHDRILPQVRKLAYLSSLMAVALVSAQTTAYSPPVGGMTIPAAANSDTFVSAALTTNAVWVGTVASVSGSDITVAGAPGWMANAFITPGYHFARLLSGAQAGHYFSIISNSADTLSVDAAGMNLSAVVVSDKIEIAPYWTLGTLFPASQAGISFIASASPLSQQTLLLFFDATAIGINRSASAIYFFYNGAWRKSGSPVSSSFNSTIIYPDSYFILRNKAASTSLTYTGRVQPGYLATVFEASTTQNDNFVALAYPVNVTLNQSGLYGSGFAASASPLSQADQLLWFDPAGTGTNRSASAIYFYYNGGWRKSGASVATDFGNTTLLTAGGGFIIRKKANGTTSPWVFVTGF